MFDLHLFSGNNFNKRLGHGDGPNLSAPKRVDALQGEHVIMSVTWMMWVPLGEYPTNSFLDIPSNIALYKPYILLGTWWYTWLGYSPKGTHLFPLILAKYVTWHICTALWEALWFSIEVNYPKATNVSVPTKHIPFRHVVILAICSFISNRFTIHMRFHYFARPKAFSADHGAALLKDGRMFLWGSNRFGQSLGETGGIWSGYLPWFQSHVLFLKQRYCVPRHQSSYSQMMSKGCIITSEAQGIQVPWNNSQFPWLDP